jgi:hypothetical protein
LDDGGVDRVREGVRRTADLVVRLDSPCDDGWFPRWLEGSRSSSLLAAWAETGGGSGWGGVREELELLLQLSDSALELSDMLLLPVSGGLGGGCNRERARVSSEDSKFACVEWVRTDFCYGSCGPSCAPPWTCPGVG